MKLLNRSPVISAATLFDRSNQYQYDQHRLLKRIVFHDEYGHSIRVGPDGLAAETAEDRCSHFANVHIGTEIAATIRATPLVRCIPNEEVFPSKFFETLGMDLSKVWSLNGLAVLGKYRKRLTESMDGGGMSTLSHQALRYILAFVQNQGAEMAWCTTSNLLIENTVKKWGFVEVGEPFVHEAFPYPMRNHVCPFRISPSTHVGDRLQGIPLADSMGDPRGVASSPAIPPMPS